MSSDETKSDETKPSPQSIVDGLPAGLTVRFVRGDTEGAPDYDNPDKMNEQPLKTIAVFDFCERGFGFGEFVIIQTPEGVFVDSEYMSAERIKRYLCALVDSAVFDHDNDPVKHALYNKVRGRRCNDQCEACKAATLPQA